MHSIYIKILQNIYWEYEKAFMVLITPPTRQKKVLLQRIKLNAVMIDNLRIIHAQFLQTETPATEAINVSTRNT